MHNDSLFWADQIARQIFERKTFYYIKKRIPELRKYVVKTSASISGVLHIGRLSDTIRGESVHNALKDLGVKTELIWVAEDMDPLRKIPRGVPENFQQYIGAPVTDIPDPWGCHKTYAEHHISEYLKVITEFVSTEMKTFSMREEYKKGNFNPYIKTILASLDTVREIQNKYRRNPLPPEWSPWQPICENCGKIITPRVIKYDEGMVHYKCSDYSFEKTTARGCGHEGINDPLKGEGKLVWKSEWAAQWAYWKVVSEGAGKEYQVPGSAFWINGEIAERILDFPMPVPIFYEHLMIEGQKMSASIGNVVYPHQWLEVAPPELLRFLYNKKLMKTRSFSWQRLPALYSEYDMHERVYFGKQEAKTPKEKAHIKRLYELSQTRKPTYTQKVPFEFCAMLSQVFPSERINDAVELLKKTGHLSSPEKRDIESLEKRMSYARRWVELYAHDQYGIRLVKKPRRQFIDSLSATQVSALREFASRLSEKDLNEKELYDIFWEISKKHKISAPEFFKALYRILFGRDSGPKLAPFIIAIGQKKIAKILSCV